MSGWGFGRCSTPNTETRSEPSRIRTSSPRPKGVRRLLFVGDSVTRRAEIVGALEKQFAEHSYEFWNVGVDGYDTEQELLWFKGWNQRVDPDHVILTFHNNDFTVTPVAFVDDRGQLCVRLPDGTVSGPFRWLMEHSALYRLYRKARAATIEPRSREEASRLASRSLREFRDLLAEKGVKFTVLVFPVLDRTEDGSEYERWAHGEALRILRDLGIRHFDLAHPLKAALDEGVDVRQSPEDYWHPNAEGGVRFARYVADRGLLETPHPRTLVADRSTVSPGKGIGQKLTFDGGVAYAKRRYVLLGSGGGLGGGTQFAGRELPLAADAYFELLRTRPNTLVKGLFGHARRTGAAWRSIS